MLFIRVHDRKKARKSTAFSAVTKYFFDFLCGLSEIKENRKMVAITVRVVLIAAERGHRASAHVLAVFFKQVVSKVDSRLGSFVHCRGQIELIQT